MPQGAADEALWQELVTPDAPCIAFANRPVHVPDDVPGAHEDDDQRQQQQPSRGAKFALQTLQAEQAPPLPPPPTRI